MIIFCTGHTYKYESEKICRIYFPAEKIIFSDSPAQKHSDSRLIFTEISPGENNELRFFCRALIDGKTARHEFFAAAPQGEFDSGCEKLLAKAVNHALSEITGIVPPWGILTGVRPSKLMRRYTAAYGEEKAQEIFTGFLEVLPKKALLAKRVAKAEEESIALSSEKSCSLYVSIPFCPTRCSYCSFVSHSVEQAGKLIPEYVSLLRRELESTALHMKQEGLKLETVYIGGGTPTSLKEEQLQELCDTLNSCFDIKTAREFTVEAGRPDTLNSKKLEILKSAGVTRISINPQSFSDEVLKNIGRLHSAKETEEKFLLARQLGFDNINMDLIAGLPGDSAQGFFDSIKKAASLSPENITIHTLALKRSAFLSAQKESVRLLDETDKMLDSAFDFLYSENFFPYYMYRQSKSLGNLENTGWCKKDRQCLYNIYMMEEIHTVLAAGAGAVTKLRSPHGEDIERIYNFKYPYEYISRFDELLARKNALHSFYEKHS